MLERTRIHVERLSERSPWTNTYGLARTVLALATTFTLAFNSPHVLFGRPAPTPTGQTWCVGIRRISAFCILPTQQLGVARLAFIGVLVAVIVGWRPRLTCVPHWYVSYSVFGAMRLGDGGDRVNAILCLLLVPLALADDRRWHWLAPAGVGTKPGRTIRSHLVVNTIRLQVAAIYFGSAAAKLGQEDWSRGEALWHAMRNPIYGGPRWISSFLLNQQLMVLSTWMVVVVEFALASGLVVDRRHWSRLLLLGLAFHTAIAITMGLWTFSASMAGALLLFLWPADRPLPVLPTIRCVANRLGLRAPTKVDAPSLGGNSIPA